MRTRHRTQDAAVTLRVYSLRERWIRIFSMPTASRLLQFLLQWLESLAVLHYLIFLILPGLSQTNILFYLFIFLSHPLHLCTATTLLMLYFLSQMSLFLSHFMACMFYQKVFHTFPHLYIALCTEFKYPAYIMFMPSLTFHFILYL